MYIMEYYSAIKKQGNPTICDNMDGPGWHYTKWDMPDRESQIISDITLIYLESEKARLTETE